jgi:hypothetical protein
VSTGGQSFRGDQDRVLQAGQVGEAITVSGRYVRFSVVPSTFEVRNYALTGADSPSDPDKDLPLDSSSVVFTSKRPTVRCASPTSMACSVPTTAPSWPPWH